MIAPLTIGSLFSGIGGLELGLERAGLGPVLWQAEIDPYCRRVLAHHWPGARLYDDVRQVDTAAARPAVLCGGFPCTDISLAGKGAGITGPESGLWTEYARIVGALRPRYVVVENVAALAIRGLGTVLSDLAALGFDAWWDCLPASSVGAPHRRDRIYLVAWAVSDADRDGFRVEPERGSDPARSPDCGDTLDRPVGAQLGDTDSARCERGEVGRQCPSEPQPGSSERREGLAYSDVGGQQAIGQSSEQGHAGQRGARGNVSNGSDLSQWPPGPDDVRAWGSVPSQAQPSICVVADGLWRGLPRRGVTDRPALRALGNAVVPQVAEVLGHLILDLAERGL